MNLISREDLKSKLDRADPFKLVMTLNEWSYEALHIPGSINVGSNASLEHTLLPSDEIVVYCSDAACIASQIAYRTLRERGFTDVRRYAGGLSDWQEAGYPLNGTGII